MRRGSRNLQGSYCDARLAARQVNHQSPFHSHHDLQLGFVYLIMRSFFSNTPERKQCVDMCATLTALRNYPIKYLDEKEFIDKVIKLDLTEKQLHHEHAVQTTNRRAKKALQDKQRQAATAALNNGTGTRSQHKNGTSNGSTHSTPSKPMNGVRPSAASGSAPDVPSRGSRNGSASGNGTTRSRSASNSSAQQNGRSRRKGSSQR